ncbi:cytochrome P450 family protein [Paenibacillus humicola]|uniref:cytochrome P450 family protein n=1 Tax=Paenibacillus humicola TaxID=3110540 RepID=UPI00237A4317|nr:cytochrome P450 [Paenibacillus humicola]
MTTFDTGLDLSSPDFKRNAYAIYNRLRREDPVFETILPDGRKAWMCTRYDDVLAALKDNERFTKNLQSLSPEEYDSVLPRKEMELLSNHMLSADPPDHTRLRAIVSRAFTPQLVDHMEPDIRRIADGLIDRIAEKGSMEAIADFAFPLPILVIGQMLGIPEEDHMLLKKWSSDFIAAANDRNKMKEAAPSFQAFGQYIQAMIAERRKSPRSDLTSLLIDAHDSGDRLSAAELSSTIWLLILAGHETTVNLIGNGIFALLENPDQMRLWQNDPSLTITAVEELLRYYSPVEIATARWAGRDFDWYGKNVNRGDVIFVNLASANRDPEHFGHPDRLDLSRKKNKHVAFGSGIHFCLGAPLARLEAQIALSALLQRLPNIRLEGTFDEIRWRPGILMRGLERLPVAF